MAGHIVLISPLWPPLPFCTGAQRLDFGNMSSDFLSPCPKPFIHETIRKRTWKPFKDCWIQGVSWGTQSRDPKHPHVTLLLKWMDRGQVINGVWTQVWLLVGHWLHRLTCWSFPWFSEDWLEQLYLGTGDNHTGSLSCVVRAGRENQVDDWNHLTLPSEDFKSKTILYEVYGK